MKNALTEHQEHLINVIKFTVMTNVNFICHSATVMPSPFTATVKPDSGSFGSVSARLCQIRPVSARFSPIWPDCLGSSSVVYKKRERLGLRAIGTERTERTDRTD
jgi:hypothetical protein